MPEWLPGLLVALVAIIPAVWATLQQRRKVSADVDSALVQSYKLLVSDLRTELDEARQGCQLREEELRRAREENELLYEQKMSLLGHNQVLTARLAAVQDEKLVNEKDME